MEKCKLGLIVLTAILGGCVGSAAEFTRIREQGAVDPAEAKLAEAATSVSKSLLDIAEIQMAATPPPKSYQPANPADYGMADLVSIDWAGPVEPLVNQIAKASGYDVRVLGNEPAVPIMVYVSVKNIPLGHVLRDVGFQSHKRADIVIFPKSHVIELRYANT